jgi:SHS2 domain-containing protein
MKEFETFSTTADIGIKIQGKEYEDLFRNAIKGLNYLLFEKVFDQQEPAHLYPFEFEGDSAENILVNLLSEILFLLQVEGKLTLDVHIKELKENYLKADLYVVPLEFEPEIEIKSVTYHNLKIVEKNDMKFTEIVFDV